MPDKHDNRESAGDDAFFALPRYRVVALEGADAAVFSQAQFINDVAALQPGQWQWSGWLTPKGRVITVFALLKRSEETIWLLVADADADELVQALSRYRFRSRTAIRVCTELHVGGAFARPALAHGATSARSGEDAVELDMSAEGGARCLRIGGSPASAADADVARWRLFDLEHGWPRLDPDQAEQWTPQQLSLERLHGFSVKKGCYPGQEIVARTHFLGKAKRGLVLLEADSPLAAGAEVHAAGKVLGGTVSSADAGDRHLALAVMPLEREAAALDVADTSAREIPLGGGLARQPL